MTTAAQRHGYGKKHDHGFLEPLNENGMPYYRCPTKDEITMWARTHGYPQYPYTRPGWADLSDADRHAVGCYVRWHDFMTRAKIARSVGWHGEAASHLASAGAQRRAYAAYRRKGK